MDQLRVLQRKNRVVLALKASDAEVAGDADLATLAETLLTLLDTFGHEELPRHVRLLGGAAAPLLHGQTLQDVVAAADADGTSCRPAKAAKTCALTLPDVARGPPVVAAAVGCKVSLEGLDLAQSALEDFVCSYFLFHGLSPESPQAVFRYLPTLSFVEGHIYDLDQANEDNLLPSSHDWAAMRGCLEAPPGANCFEPLRALLKERGWLSERIEAELEDGVRFWALERQLCGALALGPEAAASQIARADVETALRLKSFDYRVMNLLVYAMRCAPPDEDHLRFLAASEVLVEVGDDLADYAEDVERNSFNVYRCFLALYGPERGQSELRAFIGSAEAAYSAALARLEPGLQEEWRRRAKANKRHGSGSERGAGGGDWELPTPLDEARVRGRSPIGT